MSSIQQAIFLRERHRPQEALKLLMTELAASPDDDYLHFQISITKLAIPKGARDALLHIRKAIGLDPEYADYIAYEAHILNQLERHPEALQAANKALAMDADTLMAWIAKSFAYCGMEQWEKMETVARDGLKIYPDDESLSHALAIALRLQGRLDESSHVVAGRLERNPDDDMNLANAAWVDLHAGRHKEAEEKFLAALRLDPENEYARTGLRDAYKSRSFIYRLYLKLCLRMARVPESTRTAIFIGMFIGYKFLSSGAEKIHPMLGSAVFFLWITFVFWAHVVNSIMHAILLKDRLARHTLNLREKCDGALASTFVILAIILATIGLLTDSPHIIKAAVLSFATLFSAAHIAINRIAGTITYSLITLIAVICLTLTACGYTGFFWPGLGLVLLSTWLSFIPQLNRQPDD